MIPLAGFIAQLFLLKLRHKFKKTPALTLPQATLLMKAVLPIKSYDKKKIIEILKYYQYSLDYSSRVLGIESKKYIK